MNHQLQPVLEEFQSGRTIYVPGASGECLALIDSIAADPQRLRGVHIVSCLLPGFNNFDYASLETGATLTCFLLPSAVRNSFEAGRVRLLPLAYSDIVGYLGKHLPIDVAIAQVASPDDAGMCSLGIAADFTPLVWAQAKKRILIINSNMPRMPGGAKLPLAEADISVELDSPLVNSKPAKARPVYDNIGARVAALVSDESCFQIGIGAVPDAVWRHLRSHRNLTLASGLVAQQLKDLYAANALQQGANHIAGVAIGDQDFYKFLSETGLVSFAPASITHSAEKLQRYNRFTAINSALEVDLSGQSNLEYLDGRVVSGIGGAIDFARGAAGSKNGQSIVAIPSTAKQGSVSRIVPKLTSATVSMSRADADTIVTEHGVAQLKHKSIDERAEALIGIADPRFRSELAQSWHAAREVM